MARSAPWDHGGALSPTGQRGRGDGCALALEFAALAIERQVHAALRVQEPGHHRKRAGGAVKWHGRHGLCEPTSALQAETDLADRPAQAHMGADKIVLGGLLRALHAQVGGLAVGAGLGRRQLDAVPWQLGWRLAAAVLMSVLRGLLLLLRRRRGRRRRGQLRPGRRLLLDTRQQLVELGGEPLDHRDESSVGLRQLNDGRERFFQGHAPCRARPGRSFNLASQ